MSQKKHILLLYIARTSSSYIWQLFKGFSKIHVYGEILNGPEKYLKPLNASEKLGIPDETDSYREFSKKNLEEYLKFLGNESPEEYYFTKISLVHISSLIKTKSPILMKILHDPHTHIIVLRRNLIDTYVSLKKVGITNAWRETDTTDIKIEIDHEDFLTYYNRMTLLYKNLFDMLEGKNHLTTGSCSCAPPSLNYLIIDYDELHPVDWTDIEKAQYLQKRIKEIGLNNLEIDLNKFNTLKFMCQQDKNIKYRDKIKRYKAFKNFLKEHNIDIHEL